MSATDLLVQERATLCDTLAACGPEAPTLCEGWLTADLAAHLLVRETRIDGGPGIVFGGPFANHTQNLMEQQKAKGYDVMVAKLRSGPPWLFRVPMAALNVGENWIHHEDVRRANGEGPRPADAEIDDFLWGSLKMSSLLAKRRLSNVGFVLRTPGGRERIVKEVEPKVTLTGEPGELVLFLSGRKEAAVVELDGPPAGVAVVIAAKFGL